MKFGMLHLFESPAEKAEYQVVREQLELMRAAEDLGFDSVWPCEHHFSEYGYCASPPMMLASVAAATKHIRLGTGVTVLPLHDPIRVAEETALLDLMSDGRVEFGIGRGYQPAEYRGFGVDQTRSREIFSESLTIVLRAWTHDRVDFRGAYFNVEDQPVRPKPLQKPHPPVWVAALSAPTFPMVGSLGFNLLCAPVSGFGGQTGIDLLGDYRTALKTSGHDPADKEIGALVMVYCGETNEQARRDFSGAVMRHYRSIGKYFMPPAGEPPVKSYEQHPHLSAMAASIEWEQLIETDGVICGDRDHCIERLATIERKYGYTQILCWTRLGGLESGKVAKSMEMMQKHVIPHFRKQSERREGTAEGPA